MNLYLAFHPPKQNACGVHFALCICILFLNLVFGLQFAPCIPYPVSVSRIWGSFCIPYPVSRIRIKYLGRILCYVSCFVFLSSCFLALLCIWHPVSCISNHAVWAAFRTVDTGYGIRIRDTELVPNAGCRNGIRIRDAEWDPNVVHIDARFLFKIQGAYTLSNNNHIVLTVDTGYRYGIRDTECGPSTGYGIRIQDTRCEFTPKRRIESRYRIQMQDTGYRMGPNLYRCRIRIRITGYGVCPTLSVAPGTGYGYGIRDTEFAPLMPAAAAVQCKIRCTRYCLGPKYRVLIQNWAMSCRIIRYGPYIDSANPRNGSNSELFESRKVKLAKRESEGLSALPSRHMSCWRP